MCFWVTWRTGFLRIFFGNLGFPGKSVTPCRYVAVMGWENASHDEIERGLGHFFGLSAAGLANACVVIVEADRAQLFLADGSPDMVQWLSARYGLAHRTARRLVETARRLAGLPRLTERFQSGDLSFDRVEAIARMATAESESALIGEAMGSTVAGLERSARKADYPETDPAQLLDDRYCYIQRSLDGMQGRLTARLPGVEMDLVESAVRTRADRMPVNPDTGVFDSYPQRMADGLVELASTTGDESRAPAQITVHADLTALVSTEDQITETELGSLVANETARRLGCDSLVECAVFYRNQPLGVGRNSRTVPRWLRRRLWDRDGGCRFPGCGRTQWVHAHHIIHWARGGPTDLANLILLCGFHHRFLHEHGWSIVGTETGFQFHRPDGRHYPPPRPELHPRLRALVDACI